MSAERLAAAGRILVASVIAADDRMAGRDDADVMALMGEDLAVLYDGGDEGDEGIVWGTVSLLRLVDLALAHAAHISGMTRAELAVEVVEKATALQDRGVLGPGEDQP